MDDFNLDLAAKAILGDAKATRLYCGSYTLVEDKDLKVYRCKGEIPEGYTKVDFVYDSRGRTVYVYDNDGFLLSQFWSLPRI